MPQNFKVITRDLMSTSTSSFETLYTAQTGSTIVVIGLMVANVHTAEIAVTINHQSTTTQTNQVQNTTSVLCNAIPIPIGSTFELLSGNKVVMNQGDIIGIKTSVADKASVTMSYMEIT